jgi:hypothetical protein
VCRVRCAAGSARAGVRRGRRVQRCGRFGVRRVRRCARWPSSTSPRCPRDLPGRLETMRRVNAMRRLDVRIRPITFREALSRHVIRGARFPVSHTGTDTLWCIVSCAWSLPFLQAPRFGWRFPSAKELSQDHLVGMRGRLRRPQRNAACGAPPPQHRRAATPPQHRRNTAAPPRPAPSRRAALPPTATLGRNGANTEKPVRRAEQADCRGD